jgi:hypothetical protein
MAGTRMNRMPADYGHERKARGFKKWDSAREAPLEE